MKRVILSFSLIFCCLLCSCTQYSQGGYEFNAGVTVDIGELDSIFATTPNETESTPTDEPDETEPETDTEPNIEKDGFLYWTASGTKYHIYRDCQSLKNSTKIESGTLDEAKSAKKSECCKYCSNRLNGDK